MAHSLSQHTTVVALNFLNQLLAQGYVFRDAFAATLQRFPHVAHDALAMAFTEQLPEAPRDDSKHY